MRILEAFPPVDRFTTPKGAESSGREVTALHSGNAGDIIYSLPTCYQLGVTHFIINVCEDPGFGKRAMSLATARSLGPLLVGQGAVREVSVITSAVPWEYPLAVILSLATSARWVPFALLAFLTIGYVPRFDFSIYGDRRQSREEARDCVHRFYAGQGNGLCLMTYPAPIPNQLRHARELGVSFARENSGP